MKTQKRHLKDECEGRSRSAVYRAIGWLDKYIRDNPQSEAAIEAQNIIGELERVPLRPTVEDIFLLLGQIATGGFTASTQSPKGRMGECVNQ